MSPRIEEMLYFFLISPECEMFVEGLMTLWGRRTNMRGFLPPVRACGGNGSVRAACHALHVQCFPVWLGRCPPLLMVSQRWVVCDAHPAQPPLTDLRGDNWLLSSITHLAFQMALWDSQAVVAAATWLCLSQNTPQRGKGCHLNKKASCAGLSSLKINLSLQGFNRSLKLHKATRKNTENIQWCFIM